MKAVGITKRFRFT